MAKDDIHLEIEKRTAEEREIDLEKSKVELESARIKLATEQLEHDQKAHEFQVLKLQEEFDLLTLHTARLAGPVDAETVGKARTELYALSAAYPDADLTLDINSGGGSVTDGMELYGIIRELSRNGHHMITRISGIAASMGGVLAQAGDTRQIREGSYLHLHEAAWGSSGKAHEMKEAAEYVEKISKDISKIYAKRSKMSAAEIYDRFHRREWYLDCKEALKVGFVDEIV